MELLFIDESGDNGFAPGSTEFFVLGGLSIESVRWKEYFWKIDYLKREISRKYGVRLEEFKASDIFQHRGSYYNSMVQPKDLLDIYTQIVDLICEPFVTAFVIGENKNDFRLRQGGTLNSTTLIKLFNQSIWKSFLSMYDSFLQKKAVIKNALQIAIVYSDSNSGQEKYIRSAAREFSRRYDTSRKFPETGIVEDIVFKDSKTSPIIQLADTLVFSMSKIITSRKANEVISITPELKNKLMTKLQNNLINNSHFARFL